MPSKSFSANGKLLVTGEYVVLDGALALALPTKLGQAMDIEAISSDELIWESRDADNSVWFQHSFPHFHKEIVNSDITERLRLILRQAQRQNPTFLKKLGFKITTKLTFPRKWGLGTSSTLIHLIAQWAKVDPFELLFHAFGGSGYDIACAGADGPITYQLIEKNQPIFQPIFQSIPFNPPFKEQLYFVYLDKKQDSKEGIARYRAKSGNSQKVIEKITQLSTELVNTCELFEFEQLLNQHEAIISELIELPKVKDLYFRDYWGTVKSLGAWGGDFVLVTSHKSETETREYFNEKGFKVFLKYSELIKAE
ncbi:MAG: GYDIA family GHMP kinase [Bacteroidota bacterium]